MEPLLKPARPYYKMKRFWLPVLFLSFVIYVNVAQKSEPHEPAKPIKETCEQVSALFGANSSLTDVQKPQVFTSQYYYHLFEWDLIVQDVQENGNDYTVIAKCPNSSALVGDVYIKVSWLAKKFIAGIHKGETRRFSGVIKSYNILGIQAMSLERE